MKTYLIVAIGIVFCLALSHFPKANYKNHYFIDEAQLEKDMQTKFSLRDNFKEKGNSGRYLKIYNLD